MKLKWLWLTIGVLAGLGLVLLLGLRLIRPYNFHGTVLQSVKPAADFTLQGANGDPVSLSDFEDGPVILYFGYTYCPDVCPATLAEVAQAMELLGEQAEDVQVIMITVDPERDTPQVMQEYMEHFDPDFIGLSGSLDEISKIAALYGIYFEKSPGSSASDYLVDHTASLMLVDDEGYLKIIWPFGTVAEDLAQDIKAILR